MSVHRVECGECANKFEWAEGQAMICTHCGKKYRPSDYGLDDSLAPKSEAKKPAIRIPASKPAMRVPSTLRSRPSAEEEEAPAPRGRRSRVAAQEEEPQEPGFLKKLFSGCGSIIVCVIIGVTFAMCRQEGNSSDLKNQVLRELKTHAKPGPAADYILALIERHHSTAFHGNYTIGGRHKPDKFDQHGYTRDLMELVKKDADAAGRSKDFEEFFRNIQR